MIYISLFGLTSVTSHGRHWDESHIGGVKQRQILELLALNLGDAMSKELLAECLWDGEPPPGYVATLESYVCLLRGRLGLGRGPRSALATTTKGYRLDPAQVRVDLVEARAVLEHVVPGDVLGMLDR